MRSNDPAATTRPPLDCSASTRRTFIVSSRTSSFVRRRCPVIDTRAPAVGLQMLSHGTRLGPYEIVASLGRGGMGEVYQAHDTRLDRTVAIKVMGSAIAGFEGRESLEQEARAIAALNHPHICALHDVGHERDTPFLV